jgi:hypothetical protein
MIDRLLGTTASGAPATPRIPTPADYMNQPWYSTPTTSSLSPSHLSLSPSHLSSLSPLTQTNKKKTRRYRPEWNRQAAETFLATAPIGSFGVRPSSQARSLALSHTKADRTVGHAILHVHSGEDGHYGYSIEDRGVYYDTLSDLLHGLSDLRFDLLSSSASDPQQAYAARQLPAPSLVTSAEFKSFLPRKVSCCLLLLVVGVV